MAADPPWRPLEEGLFSALEPDDEGALYDSRAAAYDRLVSSSWYCRVAWGFDARRSTDFVSRALGAGEGWALDVAAGSCAPSAVAYLETSRPVIVLDRSLGMLRRGIARLRELAGHLPPHVAFVQADAAALPLRSSSMATVLCHGSYHVFPNTGPIASEWMRVIEPAGRLHVSSLVRGRWLGDRYLALLRRAGEIAEPRTADAFTRSLESETGRAARTEVFGNFAFASLAPASPSQG